MPSTSREGHLHSLGSIPLLPNKCGQFEKTLISSMNKGKSIKRGVCKKFGRNPNGVCSKDYTGVTKNENGRTSLTSLYGRNESEEAHPFVRTTSEAWHQSFGRSLNNINGFLALPRCQFGSASKLVGSLMVYHQNSAQVERAREPAGGGGGRERGCRRLFGQ